MRCPYCGNLESKVVDKRDTDTTTRRRRESPGCGKRFTTYERAEVLDLYVIKKDGRREAYDRQKLRQGMVKACEKRPVSLPDIDVVVNQIEQELLSRRRTEIPSQVIGELVMEALRELDNVAYIRFASVYREFKDASDFEREIHVLKQREEHPETEEVSP